jgi:hypothetical protein
MDRPVKSLYNWLTGNVILVISWVFTTALAAAEPEPYDLAMDDESMLFMDIPSV